MQNGDISVGGEALPPELLRIVVNLSFATPGNVPDVVLLERPWYSLRHWSSSRLPPPLAVDSWEFLITDVESRVVYRAQADGAVPLVVTWDGTVDGKMALQAGATYLYRFVVASGAHRAIRGATIHRRSTTGGMEADRSARSALCARQGAVDRSQE